MIINTRHLIGRSHYLRLLFILYSLFLIAFTGYIFSNDTIDALEQYSMQLVNSVMRRAEAICRNFNTATHVLIYMSLSFFYFSFFEIGNLNLGFFTDQNGESSWNWRCQGCNMQRSAENRGPHFSHGMSWLWILQEVTFTDNSFTYFFLYLISFLWMQE